MATVKDSQEHTVTLHHNLDVPLECTCGEDGWCRHVVAVMLLIYDIAVEEGKHLYFEKMPSEQPFNPSDKLLDMVDKYPPASRDSKSQKHSSDDESISKRCKEFLDSVYGEAKGKNGQIPDRNRVRFDALEVLAKRYEDSQRLWQAIEVYQYTCEYILENLDIVNNSKHYYTGHIRYMMRRMADMIRKLKIGPEQKQNYTVYFFKQYLQEETHHFALIYRDTLYRMLRGKDGVDFCISLFESQLGSEHIVAPEQVRRDKNEILDTASLLLENLGEEKLVEFLSRYHMEGEDACAKYIWYILDENPAGALGIAEKAIQTFVNQQRFVQIYEFISDRSGESGQEDTLRAMFVRTGNWSHYEKLKDVSRDWDAQLESLIDDLKSDRLHTCIDVLLHEKKTDKALHMAIQNNDLRLLDAYRHEFADTYPDEYYTQYAKEIPKLVESAKTLRDFDDIQRHIDIMIEIPGHGTDVVKLVDTLKSKYPQLAEQMDSV